MNLGGMNVSCNETLYGKFSYSFPLLEGRVESGRGCIDSKIQGEVKANTTSLAGRAIGSMNGTMSGRAVVNGKEFSPTEMSIRGFNGTVFINGHEFRIEGKCSRVEMKDSADIIFK